ncbi:MAG: iron ABC transporter permease [Kiritimatiellae bacterium]|nr:iron ABC transporter permease [Kiritimatiellia bacterium]
MKTHFAYFCGSLVLLTVLAGGLFCGAAGFGWPDLSTPAGCGLFEIRLCRLVTGFLVGAGLAVSGCSLQAVLRNPLAEPYVLGVSGGGAFGAALALVTGASALHPAFLPLGAFCSASATLAWVWGLSRKVGGMFNPSVLILTGVVVGSILSSLLLLVLTFAPNRAVHGVTWWLLGNLQTGSWTLLAVAGTLIAVAVAGLFFEARALNVLQLGRDTAYDVGVRVSRVLPLILVFATLAAASAVALSGIIGFVGLIVPHGVRRVFGTDHRVLLPCSVLFGGAFLVFCDTLARTLAVPYEIPVGVVTSLFGGPFFLYLLCAKRTGYSPC